MTLYQRLSDGVFGLTAPAVRALLSGRSFVPGADLTALGFAPYEAATPPAVEAGQMLVEVAPVEGVQQWSVVDGPPVRRLIAKSVVQERVHAIGKLAAVWTVLNSEIILLVRWQAPDWPNVYADDEGLLAVLNAVGCTEAEIEAITAR